MKFHSHFSRAIITILGFTLATTVIGQSIDPAQDPKIAVEVRSFLKALNGGGGKPIEQLPPKEARGVLAGAQSSVKVDLKLRLRLWIFPHHCSYLQDRPSYRDNCVVNIDSGIDDKSYIEHTADFCTSVNCGNDSKTLCWPSEEPARNILFAQLVKSIADGTLECVDDIECLKLAALVFAEQHQV